MKKIICFISFGLIGVVSNAQTVYVDLLTAPAMLTYSATLKNQQEKTNKNLSNIQKGQLLVLTQLEYANSLHDKVLKGLTTVGETVQNALTIKEIYIVAKDIVDDTKSAIEFAADNPQYTVFAIQASKEFKTRSVNMTAEITRVITGGESNMMDAGERQKLLNYIHTEMRLIGATAYMVKQNMYWAKINGFWRTLNPLAAWKNQDSKIMREIINNAKTL